jgi:hypothetical protein
MSNAIVMRPGRKQIAEDRLKYLDHVYTRACLYSLWDRLSGGKFS